MTRVAEYKQIGINEANAPVMGVVYRDATQAEIDEMEKHRLEMLPQEPTPEERIAALEEQNTILQECLLEMSEIIYA